MMCYMVLPSSLKVSRLPLRFCAESFSVVDVSVRPSWSSFASRLYVPTTKCSGCVGQKAMQLGGKSRVREDRDEIEVIA